MSTQEQYETILSTAENIALATELSDHTPTVRITNFLFDKDANTVYFCTDSRADKVKEIAANNTVSFTTTPLEAGTVRVTGATATLVNEKKPELFALMDQKYASFKMFTPEMRAGMNAYALTYKQADVFFRGNNTLTF